VVYVWVYESADPVWPADPLSGALQTSYAGYKPTLISVMEVLLGTIVIDELCETGPFTTTPFIPILKENAVSVAIDFVYGAIIGFSTSDKAAMKAAIKVEFASKLLVSQLDMRIISLTDTAATKTTRIVAEIRLSSKERVDDTHTYLTAQAVALAAAIKLDMATPTPSTPIVSVTIVLSSIRVIFGGQPSTSTGGGLSPGAIGGIVSGCIIIVVVGLVVIYYQYFPVGETTPTPDEGSGALQAGVPAPTAPMDPVRVAVNEDGNFGDGASSMVRPMYYANPMDNLQRINQPYTNTCYQQPFADSGLVYHRIRQ
jgi:hypothetical protein